jgi:hypothetical protein
MIVVRAVRGVLLATVVVAVLTVLFEASGAVSVPGLVPAVSWLTFGKVGAALLISILLAKWLSE